MEGQLVDCKMGVVHTHWLPDLVVVIELDIIPVQSKGADRKVPAGGICVNVGDCC